MNIPILSIIIVNWNTERYIDKCLKSIKTHKGKINVETIVVDNNSKDKSVEVIKDKYPWVNLIKNSQNYGYAKGNNIGWKKSKGKYVLFLNPDTVIRKNTLQEMLSFMEKNRNVGSCTARFLNANFTNQKIGFYRKTPTFFRILISHSPLASVLLKVPFIRNRLYEHTNFSINQEIDQPPGACFFTKKSILKKVNGMDERYELYFEDVDLAYRIKLLGYKQFFLSHSTLIHYVGKSCLQLGHGKRSFLYYKSMIQFFEKFYGRTQATLLKIFVVIRMVYEINKIIILLIPKKIIKGWAGKDTLFEEIKYLIKWISLIKNGIPST